MGKRPVAEAEFDLRRSCAQRNGGNVELLLADPRWKDLRAATYLLLKGEHRSVRGLLVAEQPDAGHALARCTVPGTKLAEGRWHLGVQTLAGPRPIGADLVVRRGRFKLRSRTPTVRERLIAAGVAILDAALAPLPAARARAIRDKARKVARALLG